MSQADELLMSLEEDTTETTTGNIVIGADRFITVPDSLKKVAVQYDHDIETVTFDCPRYWDGRDLSKMRVYVNYMRPDGEFGCHLCENVAVDTADSSLMHFDWTVSGHVTYVSGTITFLVCVKNVGTDGMEENIWHTELNTDMHVSEGMECHETILQRFPDIITQLLCRMEQSEAFVSDMDTELRNRVTQAEETLDATETELRNRVTQAEATIVNTDTELRQRVAQAETSIQNTQTNVETRMSQAEATITNTDTELRQRVAQAEANIQATDTNVKNRTTAVENYVQGITATAHVLEDSQAPTVEKTATTDSINLNFGIPKGASIKKVELTAGNHAPGTLDTYTITLTDGSTHTFQVYNGLDGQGSGDMLASIYDTQSKHTDIFTYVDNAVAADLDCGEW
jgi:hypothetical protein